MGIREAERQHQEKTIKSKYKCIKVSDARRFINKHLNYLDEKYINNIIITIESTYNDKEWRNYNE